MQNDSVTVKNFTMEENLYYKRKMVLSYKIQYPQFYSTRFQKAIAVMNRYYKTKALLFQRHIRQKLLKEAAEQYDDSLETGFPFHAYEAILSDTITYNQNCAVSLYFDQYQYTGGAHGNTVRSSDTWNMKKGRRMELKEFFPRTADYKTYLINQINSQIASQIQSGANIYFDDHEKNVAYSFQEENYFLSPQGVVIFFQLYEIAPYASGIPEFTIPYSDGAAKQPHCRRL